MEKQLSGIKLTIAMLASYSVIEAAGKYFLPVAATTTENNLVKRTLDNGGELENYIVNFKAIAADKLAQVKELFNGRNEVPIEEAQGLFLTGNIVKREGTILPMKNEKVECVVGWVNGKDFESSQEQVLRVTGIRVTKAAEAPKLDVTKFFANTAVAQTEETIKHKEEVPA